MAITVKIGRENQTALVRLEMDLRKSVNGDLMIFDHGDIDIVLSPSSNKVVAFPKDTMRLRLRSTLNSMLHKLSNSSNNLA